jgi:hypothetical protein
MLCRIDGDLPLVASMMLRSMMLMTGEIVAEAAAAETKSIANLEGRCDCALSRELGMSLNV